MNKRNHVVAYSVVSDPFRYGFLVMARTLLHQNPELGIEFRVLHHPALSPLSRENRSWLATRVPNVEFLEVDLQPYGNVFRLRDETFKTPRRLWAAFLILDAFRHECDDAYVLCLDSDMICLGKLEPDLLQDSGFAAVEARLDDGTPKGFFNTGVMSIGRDHRGLDAFRRIMATRDTSKYHPRTGRADQALLSLIFRPDNARCLPWRYNVTKRQVPAVGLEDDLARREAVFFHYVGGKPWNISLDPRDLNDSEAVALWDRLVLEHLDTGELVTYLEYWRDSSRAMAREFVLQTPELFQPPEPRPTAARAHRLRRAAREMIRRARGFVVNR